ncbi:hypothetical protein [Streptomyces sp. A30]|uniref:hypothetical protein n=1 Tax=Streptomyces sp. A30 TaxID=2789273 RepID=UPI003980A442
MAASGVPCQRPCSSPQYTVADPGAPAPELAVAFDMPGKVAEFLSTAELEPAERATLDQA